MKLQWIYGLALALLAAQVLAKPQTINLHLPDDSKLVSLTQLENRSTAPVKFKVKRNRVALLPGTYKYELVLSRSSKVFNGWFTLSQGIGDYYLHQAESAEGSYLIVWDSLNPAGSDNYERELLEQRCGLLIGELEQASYKYAFAACETLAGQKSPEGLRNLAHAYEKGRGTVVNLEKATKFYQEAFAAGDMQAGRVLTVIYADAGQEQARVAQLKALADAGDMFGQAFIGWDYLIGMNGFPLDWQAARRYAEAGARQGYEPAHRVMVELLNNPPKGQADQVEALAWTQLYLHAFSKRDYDAQGYYDNLLATIDPAQQVAAEARLQTLVGQELAKVYQGRLCIASHNSLAEIADKKVAYKLNRLDESLPLNRDQPTPVMSLLMEDNVLRLYADGLLEIEVEPQFDARALVDQCLYYDKTLGIYDLGPDKTSPGCGCFSR